MNAEQPLHPSLFQRYAYNSLSRSRRNSIVSKLSDENKPNESFSHFGKSTAEQQTQNEYPYEVIYLTSQEDDQVNLYEAPKLDQVRAIYSHAYSKTGNTSCIPKNVYPSANSSPIQYVIYPNAAQRPQSYQTPAQASQQMPVKPVCKPNPNCAAPPSILPPRICPTTPSPINIAPKICHCPLIPAPSPIKTPYITTTTEPTTTTTTITPTITTTEYTTIPITTVTPTITSTAATTNSTSSDKRCAFSVKNAFIFIGFKPKNISAIKDSLKNFQDNDDSSKEVDGLQIDSDNDDTNLKDKLGFDIEKATVNVNKDSSDQSKLIKAIEDLVKELRKPKKDHDFIDDDNDNFENCTDEHEDFDDSYHSTNCECETNSDLVEACKNLKTTIDTYQKNNR